MEIMMDMTMTVTKDIITKNKCPSQETGIYFTTRITSNLILSQTLFFMKKIITTKRLHLREANLDDAEFIFELLNSKGWLDNIGDREIRTIDDAKNYITNKLMPDYGKENIAMFIMERKEDGVSIGTCGLIKRPQLEDVDIGFAILENYGKKGYAYEAASATLKMAIDEIKIKRILGVTTLENKNSQRLLEKIGLSFEKMIPFDDEELMLFSKG